MAKANRNSSERRQQRAAKLAVLNFCRYRLGLSKMASKEEVANKIASIHGMERTSKGAAYDAMFSFFDKYQGIDGIFKQIDETGIAPSTYREPVNFRHRKAPEPKKATIRTKDGKNVDPVSDAFLQTYEWRQLRMVVLKKRGARCECCGSTPAHGIVIHVDHIKPRRRYPELALVESNLQVLCEVCNHGKGSWDDTDWRAVSQTSGESSTDSPVTRSGDGDGNMTPVVVWPRLVKAR